MQTNHKRLPQAHHDPACILDPALFSQLLGYCHCIKLKHLQRVTVAFYKFGWKDLLTIDDENGQNGVSQPDIVCASNIIAPFVRFGGYLALIWNFLELKRSKWATSFLKCRGTLPDVLYVRLDYVVTFFSCMQYLERAQHGALQVLVGHLWGVKNRGMSARFDSFGS